MKEGKKYDEGKLRYDLLPVETKATKELVKVFMAGAKKYGENTWQGLPHGFSRCDAASIRHKVEHKNGNLIDQETGCLHLAQYAWNALAMLHYWLETHEEVKVIEMKCPHCGKANYVEKIKELHPIKCFNCGKYVNYGIDDDK